MCMLLSDETVFDIGCQMNRRIVLNDANRCVSERVKFDQFSDEVSICVAIRSAVVTCKVE